MNHALEEKILKELRLDGMINAKEEVIEHLEHQLSGTSVLNPIGKNKDGVSTGIPKYCLRRRLLPCFPIQRKKKLR